MTALPQSVPNAPSIDYCEQDLTQYIQTSGSGVHSTVHPITNGLAIKGYKEATKEECDGYHHEYDIHAKIFTMLTAVKPKVRILEIMKISEPIQFCPFKESYVVGEQQYQCLMVMTKLNGISIDILSRIIPRRKWSHWDTNYFQQLRSNHAEFEMMVHTQFYLTTKGNAEFLNNKWEPEITEKDGLRGYVIQGSPPFVEFENKLKNDGKRRGIEIIGFQNQIRMQPTSTNLIKFVMGFVNGYILRKEEIFPCYIEFAVGLYNNELKLNVMDFSEAYDLKTGVGSMIVTPCRVAIQKWEKKTGKIEIDWEELQQDVWRSIDAIKGYERSDDPAFRRGWNRAFIEVCIDKFKDEAVVYERKINTEFSHWAPNKCMVGLQKLGTIVVAEDIEDCFDFYSKAGTVSEGRIRSKAEFATYTDDQIAKCLKVLEAYGVHQYKANVMYDNMVYDDDYANGQIGYYYDQQHLQDDNAQNNLFFVQIGMGFLIIMILCCLCNVFCYLLGVTCSITGIYMMEKTKQNDKNIIVDDSNNNHHRHVIDES